MNLATKQQMTVPVKTDPSDSRLPLLNISLPSSEFPLYLSKVGIQANTERNKFMIMDVHVKLEKRNLTFHE